DVEHRHARTGLAPGDDEVEVVARGVRDALAVRLRAFAPEVSRFAAGRAGDSALCRLRRAYAGHAASSTARRAPSSMVGSGWLFSRRASARICRPSSAFVPSSRTTIG